VFDNQLREFNDGLFSCHRSTFLFLLRFIFRPCFFHPSGQRTQGFRIIDDHIPDFLPAGFLDKLGNQLTECSHSEHNQNRRDSSSREHKPVDKLLHKSTPKRLADAITDVIPNLCYYCCRQSCGTPPYASNEPDGGIARNDLG
jgi:hypothetical protein